MRSLLSPSTAITWSLSMGPGPEVSRKGHLSAFPFFPGFAIAALLLSMQLCLVGVNGVFPVTDTFITRPVMIQAQTMPRPGAGGQPAQGSGEATGTPGNGAAASAEGQAVGRTDSLAFSADGQPGDDEQGEAPAMTMSKADAKVEAVIANKKDFVDDVNDISRRILLMETQGIFATMARNNTSPVFFDAHIRESLPSAQNGLVQVMAKKLIADRLAMSPETAGTRMHRMTFHGTSLETTCIPDDPIRCDPQAPYRSMSGVCNNLEHKMWGRSMTAQVRIRPAKYADGIWAIRKSVKGADLPAPRNISLKLAKHVSNPSFVLTTLQMAYGQMLSHDIAGSMEQTDSRGNNFLCCSDGKPVSLRVQHPSCENIMVPNDDDFYSNFGVECMNFVRSQLAPKMTCAAGHQDQLNKLTSFLDLSQMYGNTDRGSSLGREFAGGRLRATFRNGRQLMQIDDAPRDPPCGDPDRPCFFAAGDQHVNMLPHLIAMHLLWHREHERVASELVRANPGWNDETAFQEARRVVVAEYQHIFLNEYAPTLFGSEQLRKYALEPTADGAYSCLYNASVNPGVANEFVAAAYRFGHSQSSDFYLLHDQNELVEDLVGIHKSFFRPGELIYNATQFTNFLRGLMLQPAQQFENFFSNVITTQLLRTRDKPFGFDLISFDIQRGRDHGLPPYVDMVEVCGMGKPKTFKDLIPIMGRVKAGALSRIYTDVADVDLFVGGMCENPMRDALVGPTFACVIGDQFQRLRIGDRFFYDAGAARDCNSTVGHPNPFTQGQLAEIKKASLAAILCDNGEGIGFVSQFPMRLRTSSNRKMNCRDVPRMNLTVFADRRGSRAFPGQVGTLPQQFQQNSQQLFQQQQPVQQATNSGFGQPSGQQFQPLAPSFGGPQQFNPGGNPGFQTGVPPPAFQQQGFQPQQTQDTPGFPQFQQNSQQKFFPAQQSPNMNPFFQTQPLVKTNAPPTAREFENDPTAAQMAMNNPVRRPSRSSSAPHWPHTTWGSGHWSRQSRQPHAEHQGPPTWPQFDAGLHPTDQGDTFIRHQRSVTQQSGEDDWPSGDSNEPVQTGHEAADLPYAKPPFSGSVSPALT